MSHGRIRTAIVTGAGRGIGRAVAGRLAHEGMTVIVTDLDAEAAEAAAKEIGAPADWSQCDVTSLSSVEAMVATAHSRYGAIDVLVNNAGWDKATPFVDSEVSDWERVIDINLRGVLNTTKAVLPLMVAAKSGTIVNVASDAGRVGSSGEAVYSAAKGGVIAFTKSVAREAARHQVTANCVCPGPTDTALLASIGGDDPKLRDALVRAIPLRRLAEPDDIANAIAFMASERSNYITGQVLSVSGGLTMS